MKRTMIAIAAGLCLMGVVTKSAQASQSTPYVVASQTLPAGKEDYFLGGGQDPVAYFNWSNEQTSASIYSMLTRQPGNDGLFLGRCYLKNARCMIRFEVWHDSTLDANMFRFIVVDDRGRQVLRRGGEFDDGSVVAI